MSSQNKISAVVFDWAGTTVDYGSSAPSKVFDIVFSKNGIKLTLDEINGPMGMEKKAHIRSLLSLNSAKQQWFKHYGRESDEKDIQRLYEEFEATLYEIVADYSDVAEGAMDILEDGFEDAMTVMALPKSMRMALRSSNHLERQNGELRARGKIIKLFPNEASLNRLMGAVLMEIHDAMITRTQGIFPKKSYERMELDSEEKLIQIAEVQHLNAA